MARKANTGGVFTMMHHWRMNRAGGRFGLHVRAIVRFVFLTPDGSTAQEWLFDTTGLKQTPIRMMDRAGELHRRREAIAPDHQAHDEELIVPGFGDDENFRARDD